MTPAIGCITIGWRCFWKNPSAFFCSRNCPGNGSLIKKEAIYVPFHRLCRGYRDRPPVSCIIRGHSHSALSNYRTDRILWLVGTAESIAVRHLDLGVLCGVLKMAARRVRPLKPDAKCRENVSFPAPPSIREL